MTMLMERMQALEEDNARLRELFATWPAMVHVYDMFAFTDGVRLVPQPPGSKWLMRRPGQKDAENLDEAHLNAVAFFGMAHLRFSYPYAQRNKTIGEHKSATGVTVARMIEELQLFEGSSPVRVSNFSQCVPLGMNYFTVS